MNHIPLLIFGGTIGIVAGVIWHCGRPWRELERIKSESTYLTNYQLVRDAIAAKGNLNEDIYFVDDEELTKVLYWDQIDDDDSDVEDDWDHNIPDLDEVKIRGDRHRAIIALDDYLKEQKVNWLERCYESCVFDDTASMHRMNGLLDRVVKKASGCLFKKREPKEITL